LSSAAPSHRACELDENELGAAIRPGAAADVVHQRVDQEHPIAVFVGLVQIDAAVGVGVERDAFVDEVQFEAPAGNDGLDRDRMATTTLIGMADDVREPERPGPRTNGALPARDRTRSSRRSDRGGDRPSHDP
jgi:hypothetical protein